MPPSLQHAFENLATDMRAEANPDKAPQMEAYMKGHFSFLGLTSPERKALEKPLLVAARTADVDDILAVAAECWLQRDREFQYVGCALLRAQAKVLRAEDLGRLHHLIVTKSWWDTIDALAAHPVGTLVARFPELTATMDLWIDDDNMWVARTAILHQLRYKDEADQDRLFAYATKRAADTEFFIRKALGWALRNHARVAPEAVRSFVQAHENELSGLTKREALKHL